MHSKVTHKFMTLFNKSLGESDILYYISFFKKRKTRINGNKNVIIIKFSECQRERISKLQMLPKQAKYTRQVIFQAL